MFLYHFVDCRLAGICTKIAFTEISSLRCDPTCRWLECLLSFSFSPFPLFPLPPFFSFSLRRSHVFSFIAGFIKTNFKERFRIGLETWHKSAHCKPFSQKSTQLQRDSLMIGLRMTTDFREPYQQPSAISKTSSNCKSGVWHYEEAHRFFKGIYRLTRFREHSLLKSITSRRSSTCTSSSSQFDSSLSLSLSLSLSVSVSLCLSLSLCLLFCFSLALLSL